MLYLINALLAINVIVCLLIILLVLMQRPRNEGLGAAFGGGVTEGLFGTQTTHVLAKLTRWLGGIFFVLTLVLSLLYSRNFRPAETSAEKILKASATPPPLATPVPGAAALTPGTPPAVPDGGVVPPPATPEGAPASPAPAAPEGTPAIPTPGTPDGAAAAAVPTTPPAVEPAPTAPAPTTPAPETPK